MQHTQIILTATQAYALVGAVALVTVVEWTWIIRHMIGIYRRSR